MKIPVLLIALLSSSLAVNGLRAAEQPAAAHEHGDHEHTELGEHMEKMGSAFRRLGRQINDATKNEDSLKQVEIIRTNAEASVKLQPEKTRDIPADQQAKFVASYEEKMKSFLADVNKLETALKAGNNTEAVTLVKTLKSDMDDSHKEFRKKKEKKG